MEENLNGLSAEQISDLCEAFSHFDKDGNGFITLSDFRRVMLSLGQTHTDGELEAIMVKDFGHSGAITLDEFLIMMSKKKKEMRRDFISFDRVDKGFVTAFRHGDDFRRVMKGLGEDLTDEELKAMLHDVTDSNGRINFS